MTTRRRIAPFVLSAFVMLGMPSAFPHALVVRSNPSANASVQTAPREVSIFFSERIEAARAAIVVEDANGLRVDDDDSRVDLNGRVVRVTLKPLSAGTYSVKWRVRSTDTHKCGRDFHLSCAEIAYRSGTWTFLPDSNAGSTAPSVAPSERDRDPIAALGACPRAFLMRATGPTTAFASRCATGNAACLDRRTRHGAVGTKHAAIARQWLERLSAALAHIRDPARVGRHLLDRSVSATRASQYGFHLHQVPQSLSRTNSLDDGMHDFQCLGCSVGFTFFEIFPPSPHRIRDMGQTQH